MSGHVALHMGPDHYCNSGQLPRGLHFNTRQGSTEFGDLFTQTEKTSQPCKREVPALHSSTTTVCVVWLD